MHLLFTKLLRCKVILFFFFLQSTYINPHEHTVLLLWILKHIYHLQTLRELANSFWQIGHYSIAKWHFEIYTMSNKHFYIEQNTLNFHITGQVYMLHDITFQRYLSSSLLCSTLGTASVRNPRGNSTTCNDSLKLENCSLYRPLAELAGTMCFNLKR